MRVALGQFNAVVGDMAGNARKMREVYATAVRADVDLLAFPDAEALIKEVRELAQQMAAHDPEVLARAKRGLNYGAKVEMAEAMQNEQRMSAELRARRDTKGS